MTPQQFLQRYRLNNAHAFQFQIFAERQTRQMIFRLPSGKIRLRFLQFQNRRAGINDVKAGKIIIQRFDQLLPLRMNMRLVQKNVRASVLNMRFHGFINGMRLKPKMIQGQIQRLLRFFKRCSDPLQKQGCFSGSPGAI